MVNRSKVLVSFAGLSPPAAVCEAYVRPVVFPKSRTLAHEVNRVQSLITLSLSALAITLTEESAMAAAAMTGDSRRPKAG